MACWAVTGDSGLLGLYPSLKRQGPRGVPAGGEVLHPAGDGRGVPAPAEGELLPRPRPRPRPRLHAALHRHARAQGHGVHHLLAAAARRWVYRK